MSKPSLDIAAASWDAVKKASAGSQFTLMASSAPIARAFRIVGSEDAGPAWATVTVFTPLAGSSLSSRALVRDNSSQGLITH